MFALTVLLTVMAGVTLGLAACISSETAHHDAFFWIFMVVLGVWVTMIGIQVVGSIYNFFNPQ